MNPTPGSLTNEKRPLEEQQGYRLEELLLYMETVGRFTIDKIHEGKQPTYVQSLR